jgi:transmembrane sensor
MMRDADSAIIDQAISWHVRRNEMSGESWQDFIRWLEQDPAHAAAYDRIAIGDRLEDEPGVVAKPANDDQPPRHRWRWVAGAAIAASIAVTLAVPMLRAPASQPYLVTTEPGQRQTVQLADGSRIEMGGGSRLRLDRSDARIATLEAGEAVFSVRHDAAHPYTLRSGEVSIRDLGTAFNVSREGPRLEVQVSQGSVMVESGSQAVTLVAGNALVVREDARLISRAQVPVATVGGWRSGLLRFEGAPLGAVVATVHRVYGTDLVLSGDLPAGSFTGMIQFSGAASQDIPHLAALMGVGWRRNGEQWILTPRITALR